MRAMYLAQHQELSDSFGLYTAGRQINTMGILESNNIMSDLICFHVNLTSQHRLWILRLFNATQGVYVGSYRRDA